MTTDEKTKEAFYNPRPGDLFHEMYSFWMLVCDIGDGEHIRVMHLSPPGNFADNGEIVEYSSHISFMSHYAYKKMPGFWVALDRRGVDVQGLYQRWISRKRT
jgi:hypothetical protein